MRSIRVGGATASVFIGAVIFVDLALNISYNYSDTIPKGR